MTELLLALTLIAAASTALLLGLFLARERASAREAREELARNLASFSQTLSAQMGSIASVQNNQFETLRGAVEQRLERIREDNSAKLEQISGRVNERLEEGFKKTNETFVNVMQRLATIDEAQKKIETLTGSVVSLQELLGDKRSRGAFGEVQLEALVRNVLPPAAFEMQYTLSTGARADCVLRLPEPTGLVCVDSKFPLENYKLMLDPQAGEAERAAAQKAFRGDVKKHVDAIAGKYIIENETSDGAVMFVPAEAVFAEIHAYHPETVEYANAKRVWIVSPTTLMAVLNTARAVLKDVETRKQIHVIKDALARLGQDFRRFDERMRKLADHIRQAHQDAEDVQVSSRKITQQFQKIESAELEPEDAAQVSSPGPRAVVSQ
ncbi:MAG TPA: DNA recombination protein RmuC [Burkholderiales bacterium]|nr:DNA recombination protein RmuC [Burkholderiales bacterium]